MSDFDFTNIVPTAAGVPRAADVVAFAPDGDSGQWKVLLIERGGEPFKGQRAFPGGYLDARVDDRPGDAAARELQEETGLSVQAPAPFTDEMPPIELLTGRLAWLGVYDTPGRDPRMQTSTDAYVVVLDDEPTVEGADDAAHAAFYSVPELVEAMEVAPAGERVLAFDHDLMLLDALEVLKQFDADPVS